MYSVSDYLMSNDKDLFWCYIKQIMNVFSFVQWNKYFHSVKMKCSIQLGFASLNGTFHLSPHENICTIALINIHYLYTNQFLSFYIVFAQIHGPNYA